MYSFVNAVGETDANTRQFPENTPSAKYRLDPVQCAVTDRGVASRSEGYLEYDTSFPTYRLDPVACRGDLRHAPAPASRPLIRRWSTLPDLEREPETAGEPDSPGRTGLNEFVVAVDGPNAGAPLGPASGVHQQLPRCCRIGVNIAADFQSVAIPRAGNAGSGHTLPSDGRHKVLLSVITAADGSSGGNLSNQGVRILYENPGCRLGGQQLRFQD